jgi:hypothetical protein
MSGWLDLTQSGLAPNQKHQASWRTEDCPLWGSVDSNHFRDSVGGPEKAGTARIRKKEAARDLLSLWIQASNSIPRKLFPNFFLNFFCSELFLDRYLP